MLCSSGDVGSHPAEPVEDWLLALTKSDPGSADQVELAIDVLAGRGPTLGRPLVATLEHSRLRNPEGAAPRSRGRSEIRLLFVFDPRREAVFLVAGDKAGSWSRWYDEAIPLAEARYEQYLRSREADG
jgi:hypothetical protein